MMFDSQTAPMSTDNLPPRGPRSNRKAAPKDHHHVSRFYLEGFAEPTGKRHVWTYDKQSGAVRHAIAKETGFEKHLYSVTADDGSRVTALEDWIAMVEHKAAPVLAKVLRGEQITDQERADFSSFLALMYVRTNAFRRLWAEMHGQMMQVRLYATAAHDEAWATMLRRYEAEHGERTPEMRERRRKAMLDPSAYALGFPRERTLGALMAHDTIVEDIFNMRWTFIQARAEDFFIASDAPLTRVIPPRYRNPMRGGGFADPRIKVTCPLSSRMCWFGHWDRDVGPRINADTALVRHLNRVRAKYAERFLYAPCEDDGLKALAREFSDHREKMVFSGFGPLNPAEVKVTRR